MFVYTWICQSVSLCQDIATLGFDTKTFLCFRAFVLDNSQRWPPKIDRVGKPMEFCGIYRHVATRLMYARYWEKVDDYLLNFCHQRGGKGLVAQIITTF